MLIYVAGFEMLSFSLTSLDNLVSMVKYTLKDSVGSTTLSNVIGISKQTFV